MNNGVWELYGTVSFGNKLCLVNVSPAGFGDVHGRSHPHETFFATDQNLLFLQRSSGGSVALLDPSVLEFKSDGQANKRITNALINVNLSERIEALSCQSRPCAVIFLALVIQGRISRSGKLNQELPYRARNKSLQNIAKQDPSRAR